VCGTGLIGDEAWCAFANLAVADLDSGACHDVPLALTDGFCDAQVALPPLVMPDRSCAQQPPNATKINRLTGPARTGGVMGEAALKRTL